jgi:5-methylcytosine-specific restriction endonuclease McrA
MDLKEKILELRSQGKTYDQIKAVLSCSKSTISYHCNEEQKLKSALRRASRREDKVLTKFEAFKYHTKGVNNKFTHYKERGNGEYDLTLVQVKSLILKTPNCYLCGFGIDYTDPATFNFDHKLPVSRGGLNTLENLGIACKSCNYGKGDLTPEEFIEMCERVSKFNRCVSPHPDKM